MLSPRAGIQAVPAYHPPLAGRLGLRFDFNENTIGCSPRVLARLQQLTAEDLARYPEREPVEAKLAEHFGITPDELLLTNGVDEAIHLLCQTYLAPGDEALIVVPTYSMYRIYIMAAGAEVVSVQAGRDFGFPLEDVRSRISAKTRFIAIANPNNPTGAVVEADDLLSIARAAPSAALLVDEAYFEFYGQTLYRSCRELPNLFVARTFSKVYGLAGLRVGLLIGPAEQMPTIRCVSSPYNVNAVALACLTEAISDQGYIKQYVRDVLESRRRLEQALREIGIHFWPSQANFVLMRIGPTKNEAAAFVEHMRQRGILVRDRSGDPGCEGCVRITLGPRAHADRLLTALSEVSELLGLTQGARR
jgi:histidinol-phosphate aminotransferase